MQKLKERRKINKETSRKQMINEVKNYENRNRANVPIARLMENSRFIINEPTGTIKTNTSTSNNFATNKEFKKYFVQTKRKGGEILHK